VSADLTVLAELIGTSPEAIEETLRYATADELKALDALLLTAANTSVVLEPHQRPPDGLWTLWLLMAGRGAGKTQACSAYMDDHANGPPCDDRLPGGHRMGIIAPTLGDAVDACVEGPSGLKTLNPDIRVRGGVQGTIVHWPNGAQARLFGVNSPEDVERLRAGGNRCLVWMEELAAWRHLGAGLAHMRFGLRIGARPRAIGSTTPKNRPEIKALVKEAETSTTTVITTGTTYDNPHLAESFRKELTDRYEGTRLGQQELLGQLLGDLGDVFKTSWFSQIVEESPAPDNLQGTGWRRVRYWDMAATEGPEVTDVVMRQRFKEEGNDPDWTAGARVAWHDASRILVIEDVRRCRRTPAGTETVVIQTANLDGRGVPQRMEQEPGASGKTMIASYKKIMTGFSFDGMLPTGDKVTRAEIWARLAEQGRIILVAGDWNQAFLDECEEFTPDDKHDHDDQIDAVSGAVTFLMQTARRGGLRA